MEPLALSALTAGVVLAGMVVLWVVSLALRDSSIVDVAWGPFFVVVASLGLVLGDGWIGRRILVSGMVAAWGLRLGLHIGRRNRGKGEDPRYAKWREEHGAAWPLRSLVTVFLLQGTLVWLVSLPVQLATALPGPTGFTVWDALGAALWATGFGLEVVADRQLRRFLEERDDDETLLASGVWSWSRHPNYFGEALLWWGVGAVALAVPWGWATLVGPLAITLLLRFVSGVPMTEERMEGRPGWEEYARRTSVFVPMPPSG